MASRVLAADSMAPPAPLAAAAPVHGLRWAILPVFLLGAWATMAQLRPYGSEYLALALIATLACATLLGRLRAVTVGSLPVWVLLGAFILGYFIKFFVLVTIAEEPAAVTFMAVTPDRLVYASNPATAIETFRISVVGFTTFCLVAALLPMPSGPNRGPHERIRAEAVAGRVRLALSLGMVVLVATTAIAIALGAFVMGTAQEALPGRALGIIFYSRTIGLVLLTLTVMQLGLTTNRPAWTRAAVFLLFLFAVSEVLVRSTRGSLVTVALALALMIVIVRGRLEKSAVRIFGALFALALALYPVITQYRVLRRQTEGGTQMFADALERATTDSTFGDLVLSGLASFLTRFMGVDSLLYLTTSEHRMGMDGVLALNASGITLGGYFTHVVVGIPETWVHSEAPSLLGWFLMVGGWWGVTAGLALYLLAGWWIWQQIWRSQLLIKPVLQVQFLLYWLLLSSEGTLDYTIGQLPLVLVVAALLEVLLRWGGTSLARDPVPPAVRQRWPSTR